MKKYFAKYLPIEGEIKHDDMYISCKDGLYYKKHHALKTNDEDKLAKLFMCSRDIPKMGDYVVNNLDLLHGISEREMNEGEIKDNEYTKIIGEIAPTTSTWVVEGDEFDEDDFYITEECPNYKRKHMWKDCSCKMGFVSGVWIKSSLDPKNKIYFAKYLPIKVDLREDLRNARIRVTDGRLGRVVNIGMDTGVTCIELDDGTSDWGEEYDWEVVKLFICSRDIRVGDMVKEPHIMDREWCEVTDKSINAGDKPKILLSWALEGNAFKVIGSVSKYATWVNEGDEFKRDSLSAHGVGVNWNDDYGKYTFTIKGPCGHFH